MNDSSLNVVSRKVHSLNLYSRKLYNLNVFARRHTEFEVLKDTVLGSVGGISFSGVPGSINTKDVLLGSVGGIGMSGIEGSVVVTEQADIVSGSVGSFSMAGVQGSIISKDRILGSVGSLGMAGVQGSIVEGASSVIDATYNGFDENSTGANNVGDITIDLPANAVAGSLVALIACKDSSTENFGIDETGWSVRVLEEFDVEGQITFMTLLIATKVLDASDVSAGTITLSWDTSEKVSGILIASNNNGGFDAADTNHVFGSTVSVPSVVIADDGSLVVHGFVQRGQEITTSTPALQNNISEISGSGGGATKVRAMYESGISSGNSTAHSYSVNADQPLIGFTIIISGS